MHSIKRFGLLFLFGLLWLSVPTLFAQETVSADAINEVAKGLYCPVCESEPLDTCGTQACIDWREEIGVQLAAGQTKEEIYDNFVSRYGPGVLAQPPARGFTLILWLGLPLGLLLGGYFFVNYMRDLRTAAATSFDVKKGDIPLKDDDEFMAQIKQELAE